MPSTIARRIRLWGISSLLLFCLLQGAQAQDSPPTDDPVLLGLRDNLKASLANRLSNTVGLDELFSVSIDDSASVQARMVELSREVSSLQAGLTDLQARLADPAKDLPPPAIPEILQSEPPEAPQSPVPPETPDAGPVGDGGADDGDGKAQDAPAGAEHKRALDEFSEALAKHAAVMQQRAQAQTDHDLALAQRGKALEERKTKLAEELAQNSLRLEIATLRLAFLEQLDAKLKPMGEAARQSLAALKQPRRGLRDKAEAIGNLAPPIKDLGQRLKKLRLKVESGALLGFTAQRQKLPQELNTLRSALKQRGLALKTQAQALLEAANQIETQALNLRRKILSPNADKTEFDKLFLHHLGELRRLSKQSRGPFSPVDPATFAESLADLLPDPTRLSTLSETEQALGPLRSRIEELDHMLGAFSGWEERWRLAFEREALTLLTPLASSETVQAAYSLSSEYIGDLKGDFRLVGTELEDWARQRWHDLTHSGQWFQSDQGRRFLLRLVLALALIIAVALLRKRIGSLPSMLIRRLRTWSFFSKRIGQLVRWAGFFQAVLPTAALMAAGYGSMILLGFAHPEVRIFEVAFAWLMLYLLGRQILLGLTRQVSRGRPALIPVSAETVSLLRLTYGRLGLVMALAAIAQTWSEDWLGTGSLSLLVGWLVWIWLAGWILWGAFAWRKTLAKHWQAATQEQSTSQRTAVWMANHRLGALLSPWALAWVVIVALALLAKRGLAGGGVLSYFRARSLKRLARKEHPEQDCMAAELPERYTKEFPLYPIQGDEGTVLLDRDNQLNQVLSQLQHWQASHTDASLVLLGEKGAGKTTFLSLVERSIKSFPVTRHTISRKLLSDKALLEELAPALGAADAGNLGVLTSRLNKDSDRVILLDEAHNLFLRNVDGYQAYDALVRLVNYTSEHVFWVLVFNSFAWEFLNQSRKRAHYFRRLLDLPSWSTAELQDLVAKRTKKAGMKLRFDEVLLDDDRGAGEFQLIESAEGYFRLLREASAGNPRVATWLWLRSLRPQDESTLNVGLLRQNRLDGSLGLEGDLLFALSAVCQHENLSVDELRQVLNCSLDFAGFAVRYLSEAGFFEPKHTDPRRITLSARSYPQVIRLLKSKHLLFHKE